MLQKVEKALKLGAVYKVATLPVSPLNLTVLVNFL